MVEKIKGWKKRMTAIWLSSKRELRLVGYLFVFAVAVIGGAYWDRRKESGTYKQEILGTTSSQAEWEAGEYYSGSIDTISSPGDMKIAGGAGVTWSDETPGFITETDGYGLWTYDQVSYGADLTTDGTYIYMITGNRRPYLIRYNPELNTFKMLTRAPTSFYYGGAIAYYGGALYAVDGGEQNENGAAGMHFYRYDIASDNWTSLSDAPDTWGLGSDIISNGSGIIYAVRGISTSTFWSYDVATDTWSDTLPNIPSYQIYTTNGHALEYMPDAYGSPEVCTEGCLFAFRGNNNRQFFRFDISENQWYTATEIPSALGGVHYGSSMAYDSVNGDLYALKGYNNDEFFMYDVDTETWDEDTADTPDAPNTVYYGGALVYLDSYIYALRGNNTNEFWRYDITDGEWDSISTPTAMGTNAEDDLMVLVSQNIDYCDDADGCLYTARGSNTTTFWRYEITDKTWTTLEVVPASIQQGASMCYNGAGRIYTLRGNSTLSFYGFDIDISLPDGGNWTTLTSMPSTHSGTGATGTANVRYGASITCVGTTVYALKGNNSNHFFSFNGSSWSEETISPYQIYYGSATANDGTDIYTLMGNWRGEFYQYDVSESSWSPLDALPTGSYYNGNLIYDGSQYIYAISGDYRDYFWRYDVVGNSWKKSANFPERTNGYHASLAIDTTNSIIYASRGFNTQSVYKADFTTDEYLNSANWISPAYDLNYVSSFASFASTSTMPGSTSIAFYSRTAADKVGWSDWAVISGGAISSPERRYIQLKVVLNSDGTNTPTLSDYTINYSGDGVDPENPTVTGYADSTQAVEVISGNSYYYTQPYFVLSGASDAGSGVAGYYVRWTDDENDDPDETEDYYQIATTYEVNAELDAGDSPYYLRVATKDNVGNVSDPVTLFTYVYNGISSAATQVWTMQADFETAGTTSSNINTGAGMGTDMTLSSVTGGGVWMDLAATYGEVTSATAYNDTSLAFDGDDTIYVLRAVNSKSFYKYTMSTKVWAALSDIGSTANAYYGAVLEYVSGETYCRDDGSDNSGTTECLYAFPGNNSTEFLRYDIDGTDADTWTARAVFGGNGVGYGGSLAWNGSDYLFALRGNNSTEFYRYTISTNTWMARTSTANSFQRGAAMVFIPSGDYCLDAGGCLYAMRGNNTAQFFKYELSDNSWTNVTTVPYYVDYGGSLLYHGGYIYATRGYASHNFLRYDITNDTWEYLSHMPSTHYYGSSNSMVYDDSTDIIYLLRGYNEYSFYSYDVRSDKWLNTGLPHDQSSNGFYYAGITYDGSDTLYTTRGNNTTDFYKYTISSAQWERLMDSPIPCYISCDVLYKDNKVYMAGSYNKDNESKMYVYDVATNLWDNAGVTPNNYWLGYGANLVDGADGYIYSARGQNTRIFLRYSVSGGTWEQIGDNNNVPANVYQGGCAVKAGNYIYQIRAQNTADIFRFNLTSQTWDVVTTLADAPGGIYRGDACAYDGSNLIYVPRGNTDNTDFYVYNISGDSWSTRSTNEYWYYGALTTGPNGVLYGFRGLNTSAMTRYVPSSGTTGFEQSGSWISQIVNLGAVYDFAGLTINDSESTNTSLIYYTRTCSNSGCSSDSDNENWSDWDEVSNQRAIGITKYYTIDSTVAQYLQFKVSFASDQMYTPTVNDITLSYFVDGTAPSNPLSLTALSGAGGTEITTGNWYNHASPYFSWSGATDNAGGIGIEGYYVYFGTNSSIDPASSEDYLQTSTTYTVSDLSTDTTYYLRIKTKDYAGNVNDTTWAPFIYKLDNVAPSRPTNITAEPSVPTATDSFDFTWTAGSDSGGSSYFQYCYMRYFDEDTYDASETCISSTQLAVTGLEALTEGTNTFRVRAKDEAGNYSNSGEWETVQYRYAVTPPSEVLSVQHGVVEDDPYSHTFSWNEPTTHAFDITAYCYQINQEPTASYCSNEIYGRWTTSSETSSRFLSAFRTPNTQPGTNYLYIVAKDEAGNVDWDEEFDCQSGVGCIAFESSTISPNTPRNFSLTDASDRLAGTYRLTLGWTEPAENEGSELYKYNIYRSTDGLSYTLLQNLLHSETQSEYGYTDVGLSNSATYYYKLTALDSAGAESDYTSVRSQKPEGKFTSAPDMVGSPTITPRIRSAVIEWLTEDLATHPATSFVLYGTTVDLGSEQGTSELTGEHGVTLVDLAPDTTYYIKLKWVDEDGNIGYSANYTFDTNDAPSSPTSLSVDPTTTSTNSFTFDWDSPVDEGVTIGGYYYAVNNVPNEDNISEVTESNIGPMPAATQQGTNTFYVVAIDDVGNYNLGNYISITFSVETTPPSPPSTISITDSSDRASEDFALTVRWSSAGSTVDHYNVYRSSDGSVYAEVAGTESVAHLDSGLDTDFTYYYKITAEDNAGAEGSFSSVVSKQPTGRYLTPPEYTTDPEVVVTSSTATISWTTDRVSSSFVNYGRSTDLGESKGSLEEVVVHEVELTGLNPATNYYYRAQSFDEARDYTLEQAQSDQFTFTTSVAPAISDVNIEDVRQTLALVSWKTTTVSTSVVKYGKTTDYGESVDDMSTGATTLHTVRLSNLDSESLYHVRIYGVDIEGNDLVSDDYVFQTLAFPRIFNVTFEPVEEASSATVMVNWETNVKADSIVEFAPENQIFSEKVKSAMATKHEITISDMLDNTIYQLRAKGRDRFGNIATSDLVTYSTPFDTRPPKISEISLETAIIGAGKEATAQIIVAWKTDEVATSQVEYAEGVGGDMYTNRTVDDATLTNSHLVIVSDLRHSKPYHLRVVSKDGAGNASKSGDQAVITGRATDSVLDLIISNLQATFGWLGNIGSLFNNLPFAR